MQNLQMFKLAECYQSQILKESKPKSSSWNANLTL